MTMLKLVSTGSLKGAHRRIPDGGPRAERIEVPNESSTVWRDEMSGFTKLHSSIATSSIMTLPVASRWVWSFLLSQANAHGEVEATISGLAIAANVTLEECHTAIDAFLAPDPYSRTTDFEGRRLVAIEGGWRIVSYEKWRYKLSVDERKEYKARKQQEARDRAVAARAEATRVTRQVVGRVRGQS